MSRRITWRQDLCPWSGDPVVDASDDTDRQLASNLELVRCVDPQCQGYAVRNKGTGRVYPVTDKDDPNAPHAQSVVQVS